VRQPTIKTNISEPTSQQYAAAKPRACNRRTTTPAPRAQQSPLHRPDDERHDDARAHDQIQAKGDHFRTRRTSAALLHKTLIPIPHTMAVIQSRTMTRSSATSGLPEPESVGDAAAGSGPGRAEAESPPDGDDGEGEGESAKARAGVHPSSDATSRTSPSRRNHPVTIGHRKAPPPRTMQTTRTRPLSGRYRQRRRCGLPAHTGANPPS